MLRVRPRLVAITDRSRATPEATLRVFERLARAAEPGSVLVQLRDHALGGAERLAYGRELVALCRSEGQYFAVNDRLDLALLLGADAVHLGEQSVRVEDARRLIGPEVFVTAACHDPERVHELDVDGVLLSPVLAARKGRAPLGLSALERARALLAAQGRQTLLYALGGVDTAGVRACLDAGADGVAMIGGLFDEASPERITAILGCQRGA